MSVTPAAWQASHSDFFIAREALAMSGASAPADEQNILKPPPVPSDSTFGAGPPEVRETVSATRVAKGKTVEEPAAQTWPSAACVPSASLPAVSEPWPQAASARQAAIVRAGVLMGRSFRAMMGARRPYRFRATLL